MAYLSKRFAIISKDGVDAEGLVLPNGQAVMCWMGPQIITIVQNYAHMLVALKGVYENEKYDIVLEE